MTADRRAALSALGLLALGPATVYLTAALEGLHDGRPLQVSIMWSVCLLVWALVSAWVEPVRPTPRGLAITVACALGLVATAATAVTVTPPMAGLLLLVGAALSHAWGDA